MIRVHVQVLDVYVTMDGKVVMIVQYFIVRIIMIVTIKGFATMEHVNVRLVGKTKAIALNSLVDLDLRKNDAFSDSGWFNKP